MSDELAASHINVHILEMNGESYRLKQSRETGAAPINDDERTSA